MAKNIDRKWFAYTDQEFCIQTHDEQKCIGIIPYINVETGELRLFEIRRANQIGSQKIDSMLNEIITVAKDEGSGEK